MVLADPPVTKPPEAVRAALAEEWARRSPVSPEEIERFYRDCPGDLLADDLEAFHAAPFRQRWTDIIVHIAKSQEITHVVDIGCGAGHDLNALHTALPELELYGVEPNDALRARVCQVVPCTDDVSDAPIEMADLLVCIDVLEHVPDPEAFLTSIATRAPIGCWLIEATATHDHGTPLHIRDNWAWHPGHAVEAAGWERISQEGGLHIWRRVREGVVPRATLMLCAYRSVSLPTMRSILTLVEACHEDGWRVYTGGEAGINRARSIAASRWLRETADDVFVMLDDDVIFTPNQMSRLVDLCRSGHDVVCGAYPVRDGGHLSLRGRTGSLTFGADLPPLEIDCAATGFMAVHRRVIEAMVQTLPLCHANAPFAFWPMFDFEAVPDESTGGWNYLSEDWFFSRLAQKLGFKVWLDPSILLGHLGTVEITVKNMGQIHQAITGG